MEIKSRIRLSVLIFLQFFALGAIMPIWSLYLLNELSFSGYQVGLIFTLSSIIGLIAPFLASFLADRFISSEKLYSICQIISALLLIAIYFSTSFFAVSIFLISYMFFIGPAVNLVNAIIFHYIPDRERDYGKIRVMGTIGWIVVAWFFGFVWQHYFSSLSTALILSAIASLIAAIYSLIIDKGFDRMEKKKKFSLFPKESLDVVKQKKVLFLILINFTSLVVDKLNMYAISPFLEHIGIAKNMILPVMSLGQISEIFAMFYLSRFIKKIGLKKVIIVGVSFHIIRFVIYSTTQNHWLVGVGILCHGLAYTFTASPLFILLDYNVEKTNRAGVHQLYSMSSGGLGSIIGSMFAGAMISKFVKVYDSYFIYWVVTLTVSLLLMLLVNKLVEEPKKVDVGLID